MKLRETKQVDRPSVKIIIRMVDRQGYPIDYQAVWESLKASYKNHPYLDIYQAEIHPDTEDK